MKNCAVCFMWRLQGLKKILQISYIKLKPDGKEAEAFYVHCRNCRSQWPGIRHIELPKKNLMEFEIIKLYMHQAPEIEKSEEDFITPLLEKYVMNVTSLNNYLDCPLEFYYKNLIRIPSGKSENLEFGSAIHFAIAKAF